MGSIPPELSLDISPVIPKTINGFVGEVSMMGGSVQEKLLKLDDYENRLEDEMRKIDAFKRELPLCMLLLNDGGFSLLFFSFLFYFISFELVLEFFLEARGNNDEILEMGFRV